MLLEARRRDHARHLQDERHVVRVVDLVEDLVLRGLDVHRGAEHVPGLDGHGGLSFRVSGRARTSLADQTLAQSARSRAALTPGSENSRLRSTPRSEPASMSFTVPTLHTRSTVTVKTRITTANGSGSAYGARRNRDTARTPITAGPIPLSTALVHVSRLARSNTGRTTSMMMNDGRKTATAATVAPATPATL